MIIGKAGCEKKKNLFIFCLILIQNIPKKCITLNKVKLLGEKKFKLAFCLQKMFATMTKKMNGYLLLK